MNDPPANDAEFLLWDGECGFCRQCVAWLERKDRGHKFRAVPYQSVTSSPMTAELRLRCQDALCLIRSDGTTLFAGRAVTHVLEKIGYERLAWIMSKPVFRNIVEWGYRRVASNRGWIGKLIFRKP